MAAGIWKLTKCHTHVYMFVVTTNVTFYNRADFPDAYFVEKWQECL